MRRTWSWIEKNRWTVIAPLVGLVVWIGGAGCTVTTPSPTDPAQQVTAYELQTEYAVWQKQQEAIVLRFEAAAADIERQQEAQAKLQQALVSLASGAVADLPGLLQLVLGGGFIGVIADNIRKNGVIGGLKGNRT